MKINPIVSGNTFLGLIKFKNKTINPNYIISIENSVQQNHPRYDKKLITNTFLLANGEKYMFKKVVASHGPRDEFERQVLTGMHSSSIVQIGENLEQVSK